MKKFKDKIDLFEQYLEGTLEDERVEDFEESLDKNEDFKKEFISYRSLFDGIRYSARRELKTQMDEWDEEMSSSHELNKPDKKERSIGWYYIAASIAFFIVVGTVLFQSLDRGHQRVVAEYYTPFEHISPQTRGAKTEDNLASIYTIYEIGDYDKTIELINQVASVQRTEKLKFTLANSYQATERYQAAADLFLELTKSGDQYIIESKWYLALCYLSLDQEELAVPLLEELSNMKSARASDALSVLEELN